MNCTLCTTAAEFYFSEEKTGKRYFRCPQCDLRFCDEAHWLGTVEEKERYLLHENDTRDVRYRNYMQVIADWVISHNTNGLDILDFGCGEGPMLAELLSKKNFQVALHDPFFYPDMAYADKRYDVCAAVETAEHFYSPAKEFSHLKSLLKPNGSLAVVTQLFDKNTDFASWYYRLDPTHVCFYSQNTFRWIQQKFDFKNYETDNIRFNWLGN